MSQVLSPVNYEAWRNGYIPPSEHVLIHELMHEGAKVHTSFQNYGGGFWLVTKGNPFMDDEDFEVLDLFVRSMTRRTQEKKAAIRVIGQFARFLGATPEPSDD